jgi:hypothetical protein
MLTRPIAAALVAIFGVFVITGSFTAQPANSVPWGIKLLPGYKHEKLRGIDTVVGKISKEGGLIFSYDVGRLAGNYVKAQDKGTILWYKDQVVDGRPVHLALSKDRMLFVTFPESAANFAGKVKTDEELVDMLLMVLTYTPPPKAK